MKRVKVLLVVLLAILAVSLVPVSAQDPVTLTMWSRDSNQAFLRELVDMWNASHTNQIDLTIIPAADFVTRVGAADFVTRVGVAAAGGEAPDLLPIDLIYLPAFARAGSLADITDFVDGLPFADQLIPAHMFLGTYEDRKYAVPFAAEGSVLIYNKGLFEQAGLDPEAPPTTWQEMYDAAVAIRGLGENTWGFYFSGNCPGCNAFTFLPYIWASGAALHLGDRCGSADPGRPDRDG